MSLERAIEMIATWRKGCTNGGPVLDQIEDAPPGTHSPAECVECTVALIDALESLITEEWEAQLDAIPDPR